MPTQHTPVRIALTWEQVEHAAKVGIRRNIRAHEEAMRTIFTPKNDPDLWKAAIGGAIGECVVAEALGVEWTPNVTSTDSGTGDVCGLGVRYTGIPNGGLRIYPGDQPGRVHVLVAGRLPDGGRPIYDIVGWARAEEARTEKGTVAYDNGWYIGREHLHDPFALVLHREQIIAQHESQEAPTP